MTAKVAVVTGANRGMGLETSKQLARRGYAVALGCRDVGRCQSAMEEVTGQGSRPAIAVELDTSLEGSVRQFVAAVDRHLGRIDVLVNNAAILPDEGRSVVEVGPATFRSTMEVNVYGPLLLMQLIVPGMLRRGFGRVVNVSSGAGQLSSMYEYAPSYSISKAALNALTRLFASATEGTNVLVNSVDPGWVRTEMGGRSAPRTVEQGADTIIWLATLPDGGPTGQFFHDRKPVVW